MGVHMSYLLLGPSRRKDWRSPSDSLVLQSQADEAEGLTILREGELAEAKVKRELVPDEVVDLGSPKMPVALLVEAHVVAAV